MRTRKVDAQVVASVRCGCGSRPGKILPARPNGNLFVNWVQNVKIKTKISDIILKLTEQLNKTIKWMKTVRLIFCSWQSSRSRCFWGNWLQSVKRFSALSAVIGSSPYIRNHPHDSTECLLTNCRGRWNGGNRDSNVNKKRCKGVSRFAIIPKTTRIFITFLFYLLQRTPSASEIITRPWQQVVLAPQLHLVKQIDKWL